MEFAYIVDQQESISAWEYVRQLDTGERNRENDSKNHALECGTCRSTVHLVRPREGVPFFRARPHPEECDESSTISEQIQGVLRETRAGIRGRGAVIAPRREDPLNPAHPHIHVREMGNLRGGNAAGAVGRRRQGQGQDDVDRSRELLPKTVLIHLLKDRHIFDSSLFSMPIGRTSTRELTGAELIREIGELKDEDIGKYRYVWGKIHNTHTQLSPEPKDEEERKKTKIFINAADQNNNHLPSSIMLFMGQSQALAEHFLGTSASVRCKDVWFIAYGKVCSKKGGQGGYVVPVYENWQIHILKKPISHIEAK